MNDDMDLVRGYALGKSERAFETLVSRYVNLVYSTALRQARDPHLAEEITQAVFMLLARKANSLGPTTILPSWLHRTTGFVSADTLKMERRRARREQEAYMQSTLDRPEGETWQQIAPLLDGAIAALSEKDRHAVVLRFFQNKSLNEIGVALGTSEDAAKMRLSRAIEKLRAFFDRRGVALSVTALAAAVAANSVQAAPPGLAASVASAALSGTTMTTTAFLAATKTIAMTTIQKTLATAAIAALAVAGIYKSRQAADLREQNQSLRSQLAALTSQQLKAVKTAPRLPAPQLPVVPATAAPAPPAARNQVSNESMIRLLNGESIKKMTTEQVEAYLQGNHRNAASLLAAFRATGDKSYLAEALKNFPGDPRVAFEAVFNSTSAEERQQRLEALGRAAPDNALANYLSALDCFRSGQNDQGVLQLMAANAKAQFQDYSWDFVQNAEEALRSAGYSEAEIRMAATWQLSLPQVADLNQLNEKIVALANAYRQAGDTASAQAMLQVGLRLGQQLDGSPNDILINQLNGMAIQREALGGMSPTDQYGASGQTVADRIQELTQQDATIKAMVKQMGALQATMTPQDWITYNDRTMAFGEVNALQWLLAKYAP
jgi:RNA polymerase sigma factor (sigma-70 family)